MTYQCLLGRCKNLVPDGSAHTTACCRRLNSPLWHAILTSIPNRAQNDRETPNALHRPPSGRKRYSLLQSRRSVLRRIAAIRLFPMHMPGPDLYAQSRRSGDEHGRAQRRAPSPAAAHFVIPANQVLRQHGSAFTTPHDACRPSLARRSPLPENPPLQAQRHRVGTTISAIGMHDFAVTSINAMCCRLRIASVRLRLRLIGLHSTPRSVTSHRIH